MSAIVYAVDAAPPARVVCLNALQHISLSAVTLVFPRIVAEAAGADAETNQRGQTRLITAWPRVTVRYL